VPLKPSLPRNPRKSDLHSDICASFIEVAQFRGSFLPCKVKRIKNGVRFWLHSMVKVQTIQDTASSPFSA